jgi:hypothetical protein
MALDVVVVGDGIAGGAAAQYLRGWGHHVTVYGSITQRAAPRDRPADVVILATPAGSQPDLVHQWRHRSPLIVTTTDDPDDLAALLALGTTGDATTHNTRPADIDLAANGFAGEGLLSNGFPGNGSTGTLVVGAAFAPGVSTALAARLIGRMDVATEVHVARFGTGGPACARQHHRALRSWAPEWRDGQWWDRPGGSGRELVWFPDPIGGADCYRAGVGDPMVMHHCFGQLERISSRLAATRRDRLTSPLPMLRAPHVQGLVGALRVEVRGFRAGRYVVDVAAATGRPGEATGLAAASAAVESWGPGLRTLAEASPQWWERVCAAGVSLHEFAPDR